MIENIKRFLITARYGDWYIGWENYEGKPTLGAFYDYYNGDHYVVHIGPLYFGVSY